VNPISLILVVHNEAERIADFMKMVCPLVKQIVLIDQSSTDGTKAIAARAWIQSDLRPKMTWADEPCRWFSEASNPLALSLCREPWVLVLFPDETLTSEFVAALPQLCADPNVDGYSLLRDNYIDGKVWLLKEPTMRLIRREHCQMIPVVHTDPICTSSKRVALPYVCIMHEKTLAEQHIDNVRYQSLGTETGIAPL
jgi:hypothetical protein